jgi:ABC-2 type transport system permease protein
MSDARQLPAGSPAGNIYDLGYRHYEGKRYGRAYAAWSLYVESLRSAWGFGRPARAKAAPLIIVALYALPAAIQLAISSVLAQRISLGENVGLLAYNDYFAGFGFFMTLFLVAQAPELVCRDQRYQVLPLYFTRALRRSDYALAKLGALATALYIALIIPMIALFVGNVLMKPDALAAIGSELPKALPILPANVVVALGLASISVALSSFSPRRAYAAIGLLAYFLLMEVVPFAIWGIGHSGRTTWDWSDKLLLLAPGTSLGSAASWFFGIPITGELAGTLSTGDFLLASLASIAVFTGILLFRYRRLSA